MRHKIWLHITFLTCIGFASMALFFPPRDLEPLSRYQPIYMTRAELESSVVNQPAQLLRNPSKIYVKDNLLFVNEKYEGIHVIDNSNPNSPEQIAFIKIPGNIDIAVKGNILYADNAVDLLSFNISDPSNPILVNRNMRAFPEFTAPDGLYFERESADYNKIIVGWR